MQSQTEIEPADLRKRIIEDVLCVAIMASVVAIMILGTPLRKTAAIPDGTASAPIADQGRQTADVPFATKSGPTDGRSYQ